MLGDGEPQHVATELKKPQVNTRREEAVLCCAVLRVLCMLPCYVVCMYECMYECVYEYMSVYVCV